MNNAAAAHSNTIFSFTCNGRDYAIPQKDIAYLHPSTADNGRYFVMMKNGKQYRAENLVEISRRLGPSGAISVRKQF
ncbi:hypothetical protein PTR77_14190 [Serratia bockelmannii]|uniref:hypothetical protein n=1 Tax=Serratia bockelmannii TaxID=2703793 RepID=UPI00313D0BA9